ncbi:MAG: signal peptidase I [Candidatus Moranbacteria bacterium RIFCSPHIGHO2_01_FULL_55_24]|nr:MAG: signal peptidase I [Candidatus Moranbacteria bacterium RIFCSPHIGHO2_01_FULL_55_24]
MQNPESHQTQEEYLGVGGLLFEMVKVFLLAVVIIIPVRVFLFQPFFVQGSSMEPNFEDGEYLIISEFGYKETNLGLKADASMTVGGFREMVRQDAVVFEYPKNPDQFFIKRVIGLPGEAVEIRNNRVHIYNESHPEGFVLDETAYLSRTIVMPDMPKVALGPDEYFVMGDNRMFSYDSRGFGPLKKEYIIGRVLLRAWPLSKTAFY